MDDSSKLEREMQVVIKDLSSYRQLALSASVLSFPQRAQIRGAKTQLSAS